MASRDPRPSASRLLSLGPAGIELAPQPAAEPDSSAAAGPSRKRRTNSAISGSSASTWSVRGRRESTRRPAEQELHRPVASPAIGGLGVLPSSRPVRVRADTREPYHLLPVRPPVRSPDRSPQERNLDRSAWSRAQTAVPRTLATASRGVHRETVPQGNGAGYTGRRVSGRRVRRAPGPGRRVRRSR